MPRWVKPLEIATKTNWLDETQNRTYDELLDGKIEISSETELEEKGIKIQLWSEV